MNKKYFLKNLAWVLVFIFIFQNLTNQSFAFHLEREEKVNLKPNEQKRILPLPQEKRFATSILPFQIATPTKKLVPPLEVVKPKIKPTATPTEKFIQQKKKLPPQIRPSEDQIRERKRRTKLFQTVPVKEIQAIRKQYQQTLKEYRKSRTKFIQLKQKYKKELPASAQKEITQNAKLFLINSLSAMIRRLEALKLQVQNYPGISISQKERILNEIDKDIKWLEEKIQQIKEKEEITYQELKDLARQIRQYWLKVHLKTRKYLSQLVLFSIKKATLRLDQFENRIEQKIEILKEKGLDVSSAEQFLTDYQAKIEKAKEELTELFKDYQQITTPQQAKEFTKKLRERIKAIRLIIRDARDDLIEAVKILRVILREAKEKTSAPGQLSE